MKKNPKLSIIIPVYNVEEYLSRCLESVVNQTLLDIEIICVNDGTKDNSVAIVEAFMHQDNRIHLVHKENGGLSSARNVGIKKATGDYILFLDSDDYLAETACERLYIERLENNADIIVFGSKIFPNKPAPTGWHRTVLSPRTCFYPEFHPNALFKQQGATPFVWRDCFKRSFLENSALLFDETALFGEDLIFQMCIFPQAEKIAFIADKLYNYRWYRNGSLMATVRKDLEIKFQKHVNMVQSIINYWQEKGFLQNYGAEFLEWLIRFLLVDLCESNWKNKSVYAKEVYAMLEKADLVQYRMKIPTKEKVIFKYFLQLVK